MAQGKISIKFGAKQTRLRVKNCSPEQVLVGLQLFELQAEKETGYKRDKSSQQMEEILGCLEILLASCEHPESFNTESAMRLMPIGVRNLVDYYREKRKTES